MTDKENQLLEQADRWFAVQYDGTPEQLGMSCRKIWNKPIFIGYKIPEAVYGPGEKEVDTFIKTQKLIRQGFHFFICVMPLLGILMWYFILTINIPGVCALMGFAGVMIIVCFVLGIYTMSLEKCYKGKIVTHLLS